MAITPAQLRAAFAAFPPGADPALGQVTEVVDEPIPPEIRDRLQTGRRPAAVLVPVLGAEQGALRLLLTQRTDHLRDHAGQISFPGGGLKSGETSLEAALREAEEEVGLTRSAVEIFGEMPRYHTGTGFNVSPMVAFVAAGAPLAPDPGRSQSYINQTHTTHVSPHWNLCETIVMVEMDGLLANGVTWKH